MRRASYDLSKATPLPKPKDAPTPAPKEKQLASSISDGGMTLADLQGKFRKDNKETIYPKDGVAMIPMLCVNLDRSTAEKRAKVAKMPLATYCAMHDSPIINCMFTAEAAYKAATSEHGMRSRGAYGYRGKHKGKRMAIRLAESATSSTKSAAVTCDGPPVLCKDKTTCETRYCECDKKQWYSSATKMKKKLKKLEKKDKKLQSKETVIKKKIKKMKGGGGEGKEDPYDSETRTRAYVAQSNRADPKGSKCMYTLIHDVREVPFKVSDRDAEGKAITHDVILKVEFIKVTVCKINGKTGTASQVCGSKKEILHVDITQLDTAQECSRAKKFKDMIAKNPAMNVTAWLKKEPKKGIVQFLAKTASAVAV
jgi:hypothetical protein